MRKGSTCATIIKCIGASSHSEKGVSKWVKVYEAKNAVRVSAKERTDLIAKHPMDGVRFTKPVRATDDIKFLTRDEQRMFLETAKRSRNYNQYALILENRLAYR